MFNYWDDQCYILILFSSTCFLNLYSKKCKPLLRQNATWETKLLMGGSNTVTFVIQVLTKNTRILFDSENNRQLILFHGSVERKTRVWERTIGWNRRRWPRHGHSSRSNLLRGSIKSFLQLTVLIMKPGWPRGRFDSRLKTVNRWWLWNIFLLGGSGVETVRGHPSRDVLPPAALCPCLDHSSRGPCARKSHYTRPILTAH